MVSGYSIGASNLLIEQTLALSLHDSVFGQSHLPLRDSERSSSRLLISQAHMSQNKQGKGKGYETLIWSIIWKNPTPLWHLSFWYDGSGVTTRGVCVFWNVIHTLPSSTKIQKPKIHRGGGYCWQPFFSIGSNRWCLGQFEILVIEFYIVQQNPTFAINRETAHHDRARRTDIRNSSVLVKHIYEGSLTL